MKVRFFKSQAGCSSHPTDISKQMRSEGNILNLAFYPKVRIETQLQRTIERADAGNGELKRASWFMNWIFRISGNLTVIGKPRIMDQ